MDPTDHPIKGDNLLFMSDAIQDEVDRDQADALLQDDDCCNSDEAGEDLFAGDMERYVFSLILQGLPG
jgi:hypothetical protein